MITTTNFATTFIRHLISSAVRCLFIFLCCALLYPGLINAQTRESNVEHTKNKPDQALRGNARINPSTLGMELGIPLGGAPGRAGMSLPISLRYSSKLWRLTSGPSFPVREGSNVLHSWSYPKYSENSTAGWTSSLEPPRIEFTGEDQWFDLNGQAISGDSTDQNPYYVQRIHLRLSDGSSHELRKSDTPQRFDWNNPMLDFTGKFYAVDGSRTYYEGNKGGGVLYLPDGSRYIFGASQSTTRYGHPQEGLWGTTYIDRHGNTLTYNMSARTWTDTLGRTFGNPLPDAPEAGQIQEYQVPGVGGLPLTYKLHWTLLGDALRDQNVQLRYVSGTRCNPERLDIYSDMPAPGGLFTSSGSKHVCDEKNPYNPAPFNPIVLARIELPNGQFYEFKYNAWGEIEQMIQPGGGYEQYSYSTVATLSRPVAPYAQTNRGVVEHWVSPSGTGSEVATHHWQYSLIKSGAVVMATTTKPDRTLSERLMYANGFGTQFGFEISLAGMPYDERDYSAPDASGNRKLLRRKLTQYEVTPPLPGGHDAATRNPRPVKEVELTLDAGGGYALASTTETKYDDDLNVISTSKYPYRVVDAGTSTSGTMETVEANRTGAPLRVDETTYLVNDQNIDEDTRAAYRTRNLVGLPTSTRTKDAAGIIAQSEIKYDESAYPLLTYGAVTGWTDPGTSVHGKSVRGNATTSRSWLNTSRAWIETHAQYDQYGNVRKTWDAKDTPTEVEYSAEYKFAYPTHTISAIPDPSVERGSNTPLETWTTYDFMTGKVTESKDANSFITKFYYNDPLHRLTGVELPGGGQSEYWYSRNQFGEYIGTRTLINDTGQKTESYQFFDGLGRSVRTFQKVKPDAIEWITSDTQYDNMGRVSRVSNPYISGGAGTPITTAGWTTTEYDDLGRVRVTTTADGAKVETAYSNKTGAAPIGTQVTVSHLAGQILRSKTAVTDGLGRLVEVVEDPAGLSYQTRYDYDVLGNLRQVTQGKQQRFFMYDSLSRLIRAKNPEQEANPTLATAADPISGNTQWSQAYSYDNNGNLSAKTDARGVTATYTYDALNRMLSVGYTDGTTPTAFMVYDKATNGRGRFAWDWTHASAQTVVHEYDEMGRVKARSQHFWVNGAWGPAYTTRRVYNKMGHVTEQEYPSTRKVNYTEFDVAGRLKNFTGNLGDGVQRTYATNITYDEASRMTREQFGTQTALYHKNRYNVRGQMWDVRLSTVNDVENWNRGAIQTWYTAQNLANGASGTDNNGNVLMARTYIPNDDQISSHSFIESRYDYDQLNRVKYVEEYFNGQGSPSKQQYDYDRFGNRTINAAGSFGVGIPEPQFELGPGESLTNRIYAQGDMQIADPEARRMRYDKAGNLKYDSFTGQGERRYDAENRMIEAADISGQKSIYTYDTTGKRVRRNIGGQETWQVYGIDGELVAEYAASAAPTQPQKEYGYRNGELLIVCESATTTTSKGDGGVKGGGGTPTIPNAATFVGQSVPTTMVAGRNYKVSVTMKNTGYKTWVTSTNHNLGSQAPQDNQTWGMHRVALAPTAKVANGAEYTFNFTVKAPQTPGTYPFQWRMVQDGVEWFGDYTTPASVTVTPAPSIEDDSEFVSQSVPTTMQAGQRYNVSVTMRNTGTSTWTSAGYGFNLGSQTPQDNITWGTHRANLPSTVAVAPGDEYTYSFTVTAPSTPGTYGFQWQTVHDGVRWFGAYTPYVAVNVSGIALQDASEFVSQSVPSTMQVGQRYQVSVTMKNTGTSSWTSGDLFNLGSQAPQDNTIWGMHRVGLPAVGAVAPGGEVTFSFTVRAPSTAGSYSFQWRTVHDGVRWFGAYTPHVTVNVTGAVITTAPNIKWLVSDHLGTPRMIVDQTGSLSGIRRHDYLPFGEELFAEQEVVAGTARRTERKGYLSDTVRQQFTKYERDKETGLDYAQARYYSSVMGRFTSVDPQGPEPGNPQSFNGYRYGFNNPLRYVDPNGTYETDVHLWLSYALGMAVGFAPDSAMKIAAANEGIDWNTTLPNRVTNPLGILNIDGRRDFHFTSIEQRDKLWSSFENSGSLRDLGVFMHAEQDSFSHEGYSAGIGQLPATIQRGWWPTNPAWPDWTFMRPDLADTMAQISYMKLSNALELLDSKGKVNVKYSPIPYERLRSYISKFNRATTREKKVEVINELLKVVSEHQRKQAGVTLLSSFTDEEEDFGDFTRYDCTR